MIKCGVIVRTGSLGITWIFKNALAIVMAIYRLFDTAKKNPKLASMLSSYLQHSKSTKMTRSVKMSKRLYDPYPWH